MEKKFRDIKPSFTKVEGRTGEYYVWFGNDCFSTVTKYNRYKGVDWYNGFGGSFRTREDAAKDLKRRWVAEKLGALDEIERDEIYCANYLTAKRLYEANEWDYLHRHQARYEGFLAGLYHRCQISDDDYHRMTDMMRRYTIHHWPFEEEEVERAEQVTEHAREEGRIWQP